MKKIIIILLLVMSPILVSAEETVNVKKEYVKDVYWNYSRNNILYSGNLAYFYVNDKIAYCMDLDTPFVSNIYTKSDKKLSNDTIYKYGYFGYGYEGNNTVKDYMATQKILWKYTNGVEVFFTTKENGLGDMIDISANEARIRDTFESYSRFPKYTDLKFLIGTTNIINNSVSNPNPIREKLNVVNVSNNDISVDNKYSINFKANEIGKSQFYLQKYYQYNYENYFYISDNSPEILLVGNIKDIKRTFSYEVIGGTININVKFDKEKEKSITDNQFRLYNSSNNLIGIYSPNELGSININNLYMDTYTLKHEIVTEGYNVENKEYIFEINENNYNIEENINLNLKQTKLVINKIYSNIFTNDLQYGSNILYKIYDENDNCINELITNEKGNIETTLEYGNYKIVESLNEDNKISIDKTMFDDIIEYNFHDKIYNSNLKIITLNKDTNEKIPNARFKMNDNEYVTNAEAIYVLNDVDFGVYRFENINNNLRNLNLFMYELNENSNVYIENKKPYVDIYLYSYKKGDVFDDKISNDIVLENKEENIIKKDNNIEINDNKNTIDTEDYDSNINNSISQDENIIESSKVEKLPFLGDNININENNKIITYIYNVIKFNWV